MGFFVDAVTGRTAFTHIVFGGSNAGFAWEVNTDGASFLTPVGMFDLASDEADPAWPRYLTPDLDACTAVAERR